MTDAAGSPTGGAVRAARPPRALIRAGTGGAVGGRARRCTRRRGRRARRAVAARAASSTGSPRAPASPRWTGCALAIAGCVLAQTLLSRYAQYVGHRFGERAVARLREEFVARTLRLPVSVVERAGTGDLATRSSVDVVDRRHHRPGRRCPPIVIASVHLALLFGGRLPAAPAARVAAALAGLPTIWPVDPLVPAPGRRRRTCRGRGRAPS